MSPLGLNVPLQLLNKRLTTAHIQDWPDHHVLSIDRIFYILYNLCDESKCLNSPIRLMTSLCGENFWWLSLFILQIICVLSISCTPKSYCTGMFASWCCEEIQASINCIVCLIGVNVFLYLCNVCHWTTKFVCKVCWIPLINLQGIWKDSAPSRDLLMIYLSVVKNHWLCKDYLITFRLTQSIWNLALTLHRAGARGQSEGTRGQIILDKCRLYVHIKVSLLFN